MQTPLRLGTAEKGLIEQLQSVGAIAEAERLSQAGLPTRRVEAYHYTDLKMLLRAIPPLVKAAPEGDAPSLRVPGAYELRIANGKAQDSASAPAGVIVGKVEGSALTERDDVLVRLNAALASESLTVALEGNVAPVIHIDRRTGGEAAHVLSSARIFVADGANATVLETYSGSEAAHIGNHASYVSLGKGASLTHVTLDLSGGQATHFATNEYDLGEGATLRTLAIHAGSALARTQIFARFSGEGAHADFTGLNLVGNGQHADITLDVRHDVPHTTSQEVFKQVARGRSRAIFQGRIVVARDAQKTDAAMMVQGIMLSDQAEISSKPELEIYADDVMCGHGATCGKLEEASLFYLMSRGVPRAEAETMLLRGFIADLITPLADPGLSEALNGVVDDWLAGPAE